MNKRVIGSALVGSSAMLLLAACAAEALPDETESIEVRGVGQAALASLPFEPIDDPSGIGQAGQSEARRLIRSAAQYRRLFGHNPPAEVDFGAGDAVVFYSAGVKPTGGYVASVLSIASSRGRLTITTALESPGEGCPVTLALTRPFALVRFRAPRAVLGARFEHVDTIRDCREPPSCDGVECPAGEHCELEEVVCVTEPCDPVPACVPDEPDPCASVRCKAGFYCEAIDGRASCRPEVRCGGFAGVPCPGLGDCVDDPSDDCDPLNGGADCGGLCRCEMLVKCPGGTIFDRAPEVCACVPAPNPCAAVLCPTGTTCVEQDGDAYCVSDGTQACGRSTCPAGTACCNSSCGFCLPPGRACIQIACN